jgi:hypothetical protein
VTFHMNVIDIINENKSKLSAPPVVASRKYYPKPNPENLIGAQCMPGNGCLPFRENLGNRDMQRYGSEKLIPVGFGVTSTKEFPRVNSTMANYLEKNLVPKASGGWIECSRESRQTLIK